MTVLKNDQDHAAQMLQWRHHLHSEPELGFEEGSTADFVARELEEMGLLVERGIGGTGIVGTLRHGTSSRAVGFRAELDALAINELNTFEHRSRRAGKMHACGHDGHMAMLLGGARLIADNGRIDGTVHFIFQPAEEHGRGAKAMIADGLFDRFAMDAIYALHNWPALEAGIFAVRPGPVMAAEDNFRIQIDGRGGHASSPHLCNDPIIPAAEIVLALQTIVSRSLDPTSPAVVSVTDIETDGIRNAIPSQVVITGDCRSFDPDVGEKIEARMRAVVDGICTTHGVCSQTTYTSECIPTVNAPAEADIAASVAEDTFGRNRVVKEFPGAMASEDFAHMLRAKRGAYILLGSGTGEPDPCGLHNSRYDFNDALLPVGAAFWKALVERCLAP